MKENVLLVKNNRRIEFSMTKQIIGQKDKMIMDVLVKDNCKMYFSVIDPDIYFQVFC